MRSKISRLRPLITILAVLIIFSGMCVVSHAATVRNATIIGDTIPYSMTAGKTYNVYVTVRNDSNVSWSEANAFRLGAVGDKDFFAATRQCLPAGYVVAPGQNVTFSFSMTAPSTPGVYLSDWKMVQENVTWFGQALNKNIVVNSCEIAPAVNVALNKRAYASAVCGNETADKAVNGTYTNGLSDKWCTGYNKGNGSWLVVDLGSPYYLNKWKVVHEKGRPNGDQRMWTKDFKLQASNDATNWRDIDTVANNTEGITERYVSPFTARYVRLYVTTADFDTAARIYEFQVFYDTYGSIYSPIMFNTEYDFVKDLYQKGNSLQARYEKPSVNLALNKPATASKSNPSWGEVPSKAVNGTYRDLSDKWCTGYGGGQNQWLQVDLGAYYYFDRWVVINGKHTDSRMFTKTYKLQYLSGDTWIDADVVLNNTEGSTDRILPRQVAARYVRLYVINGDFDDATRIHEFQIYNSRGYVPLPGDILLTTEAGAPAGMHAGIVKDVCTTVEADGSGVNDKCDVNKWVDTSRTYGGNVRIMRIKTANMDNAFTARNYAMSKLGCAYRIPNPATYHGYILDGSDTFYCTSLVHYSWQSAGYSLDNSYTYGALTVGDIHSDSDTYDVYSNGTFNDSAANVFYKNMQVIEDGAEWIIVKASDGVEYVYKKTSSGVSYVARRTSRGIEYVGGVVVDGVKDALSSAGDVVSDVGDTISDGIDTVGDWIGDLF